MPASNNSRLITRFSAVLRRSCVNLALADPTKDSRRQETSSYVMDNTGRASVSNSLRQARLRAAALFLAVGTGVGLILQLLSGDRWPVLHSAIALLLVVLYFLLRKGALTRRRLLQVELMVFGLSALHLATTQYHGMLEWSAQQNALQLQAAIKNAHMATMLLIFAYAMLIPNNWRAAARVIGSLALVPVLTAMLVLLTHPDVRGFVRQEDILRQSGTNLMIMLFAGSLSTYGVHILNTLRHEAREARRLNQYQLGKLLGSGGMGDVYLAEHRLLKRPCAVKLVRGDEHGCGQALVRFEREVQSAARLSHPNIVEIYDYGHSEDGRFYYVMEYLRGLSLEELVQHNGPLPIPRAIALLSQICEGLAEAHAAGLIHRDLKPANIFAAKIGSRSDVAKLLDFGLVQDITQSVDPSSATSVSGTPHYMAPEQAARCAKLDHRADIYALGGVAYFLVTGRPPFDGRSALAVVVAHANQAVRPPSVLRPDISPSLEQVILQCLEKNPRDRYRNALDIKMALLECVHESTETALV